MITISSSIWYFAIPIIIFGLYVIVRVYSEMDFSQNGLYKNQSNQGIRSMIRRFLLNGDKHGTTKKDYVDFKFKLRQKVQSKRQRLLLARTLNELCKDALPSLQENIKKIYRDFELHHDALKRLNSKWPKTKRQAIDELAGMHIIEAYAFLLKFINSPYFQIRESAEIAIVNLKDEGIYYLLNNARFEINATQQFKLIEILWGKQGYSPPEFKSWLISRNKYVVLLALALIKKFQQKSAKAAISHLVRHRDDDVRIAALQCIESIGYLYSLDTLKNLFWNASKKVKMAIIEAIGHLGNQDDVAFFTEVAHSEKDDLLSSNALLMANLITSNEPYQTQKSELSKGRQLDLKHLEEEIDWEVGSPVKRDLSIRPVPRSRNKGKGTVLKKEDSTRNRELFEKEAPIEEKSDKEAKYLTSKDIANLKLELSLEEEAFPLELGQKESNDIHLEKESPKKDKNPYPVYPPKFRNSIFHEMFNCATDFESKLLLLEIMEASGSEKEIPFLKDLPLDLDEKLQVKANRSLLSIQKRLKDQSTLEEKTSSVNGDQEASEKIPLELFSLFEEIGIETYNVDYLINPEFVVDNLKNHNLENNPVDQGADETKID